MTLRSELGLGLDLDVVGTHTENKFELLTYVDKKLELKAREALESTIF